MIEVRMVGRMVRRALMLVPVVFVAGLAIGSLQAGVSAALGVGMACANLLLAARIIGGVAENRPSMLLAAAMLAFTLGLAVLTAIAFGLEQLDFVTFKVTGLVLVATHLVVVLWEAAGAYPVRDASNDTVKARG